MKSQLSIVIEKILKELDEVIKHVDEEQDSKDSRQPVQIELDLKPKQGAKRL